MQQLENIGKTRRIILDLPPNVHERLKVIAANTGYKSTRDLLTHMAQAKAYEYISRASEVKELLKKGRTEYAAGNYEEANRYQQEAEKVIEDDKKRRENIIKSRL